MIAVQQDDGGLLHVFKVGNQVLEGVIGGLDEGQILVGLGVLFGGGGQLDLLTEVAVFRVVAGMGLHGDVEHIEGLVPLVLVHLNELLKIVGVGHEPPQQNVLPGEGLPQEPLVSVEAVAGGNVFVDQVLTKHVLGGDEIPEAHILVDRNAVPA